MADIELVIKIPEEVYKAYKMSSTLCMLNTDQKNIAKNYLINAILNGTPLPKGHGRLVDADALEKKMCDREAEIGDDRALWESSAVSVALDMFAPTIIEADKESEVKE